MAQSGPWPRRVTFGIGLFTGQQVAGEDRPRFRDAIELARAAEGAGFDVFWVSEHHGFADGYLPAPLTVLAALSAATSRMKLGTGLVLATLRHPVRLAEEASIVDHLSEGRLILGLGAGYVRSELRLFGVNPTTRGTRLADTIGILRQSWTGTPFSWHSANYNIDEAIVTPVPRQGVSLPIWLGGYARAAVRRAAVLADGHLVGRGDPEIVQAHSELLLAERRGQATPFTFGFNFAVVLDERAGHPRSAIEAFGRQQLAYEQVQSDTDVYTGRVADTPRQGGLARGRPEAYLQAFGSSAHVTDTLLAQLGRLSAWDDVHVCLRLLFPEADRRSQVERIETFGARILPVLRSALGPSAD